MTDAVARRLGKYEIVRELGSGGFATVYLARDTVLQREVALKVLRPTLLEDTRFVQRFETDARTAANLDHPHIITIYDLGQIDGRLVIALRYMPGGSVADRIARDGAFSLADTTRIIGEIAAALDHAHAAGLVHRDVKPANVLLDGQEQAVLSDFGVVKAAENSIMALSTMGGVIGTPAYIAPEIWDDHPAGTASDIYALGCLVFEMLTREPLFQGDTSAAVMRAHFKPPRFPDAWPEGVPSTVETVLARALAANPVERYPSAGALADALRARAAEAADPLEALSHGLDTALETASLEEAPRVAQEIRVAQQNRVEQPDDPDEAEPAQRARVERTLDEQYALLEEAWQAGQWVQVLHVAAAIQTRRPDDRDVAARVAHATQEQARESVTHWRAEALSAEKDGEPQAALAAARRWLELAPDDAEAGALVERLTAVSASSSSHLSPAPPTRDLRPASMHAPADSIGASAVATPPRLAGDRDARSVSSRGAGTPSSPSRPSLRPSTLLIVLLTLLIIAGIWQLVSSRDSDPAPPRQLPVIHVLSGHDALVYSVAFSPDGSRLATAGADGTARLWDAETGAALDILTSHVRAVYSVAFSPDGLRLATASRDGTARLWDAASGAALYTLSGHQGEVRSVAFSPDGSRLATASRDGTVRLWDAATGAALDVLSGHEGIVEHVTFARDGSRLATAGADGTARLWDAVSGGLLHTLADHEGSVFSVAFSPDGSRLATAGRDRTTRLWDAESGEMLLTITGHDDEVRSVAFSPDGSRLATASRDGTARLWDAASGAARHVLSGHEDTVLSVAFSPDGLRLATASRDGTVRLWETEGGAD